MRPTRWLAGSLALLAALGCTPDLTEVVVSVDTDMLVPEDLDTLRIEITEPDGQTHRSWADLRSGRAPLPRTLGLVHRGGDLGPVRVLVVGSLGEDDLIERRARFYFLPGRAVLWTMDLLRSCLSVECTQEQTCGRAGCRPIEVDPGELVDLGTDAGPDDAQLLRLDGGIATDGRAGFDAGPVDGGLPDAGPTDSGSPPMDAGVSDSASGDAGSADAGPADAGPSPECPDGPCSITRTCASSCSCGESSCLLLCGSSECSASCPDDSSCAVDARGTSDLKVTCGDESACNVAAPDTDNTDVLCVEDSSCEVDCTNASSCTVDCRGECLVACEGASNCIRTGDRWIDCGGEVWVHGRSCP